MHSFNKREFYYAENREDRANAKRPIALMQEKWKQTESVTTD